MAKGKTTKKKTTKTCKNDIKKDVKTECCEGDCCCEHNKGCGCGGHDCQCERLPLIGDKAPEFVANTTNGKVNFPSDYQGKWVVLFSHPADFTPVCTTEFMTFQHRIKEFKDLNCELLGLSIDSLHAHLGWIDSIKNIEYKDMRNLVIEFPIIVDIDMKVATKYGMVHPSSNTTSAVRAVFIIDPEGIIRTILYYPASTGRNFDELLRIITSLQTVDKEKCATPADWVLGDDVIVPPAGDTKTLLKRQKGETGMTCLDWYLCFRKLK